MARIAAHHKPEHPLAKDTDYVLTQDWPDDFLVQWGGGGLVLSKSGHYRTAFFEVFPTGNAGGFIRGEGTDIAEAEAKAYQRWQVESACEHRWGRRGYKNGAGLCVKCNAFRSDLFQPIHDLEEWKKPLSCSELSHIAGGYLREALWVKTSEKERKKSRLYNRRLMLRARLAGIDLPPIPEPEVVMRDIDDSDAYEDACMDACLRYFSREFDRLMAVENATKTEDLADFFRRFERAGLIWEARRRGMLPPEADSRCQPH